METKNPFEIAFKKLHPEAAPPSKAHEGDAGFDLRSIENVALSPGGRSLVKTGISIAIPAGWAGLVLPRSGLSIKHGISLVNTPGLIDSGYRGEIMVPLINHDRAETFTVEVGMRVAQIVFVRVGDALFVEADSLDESSDGRGEGGFGSSGR